MSLDSPSHRSEVQLPLPSPSPYLAGHDGSNEDDRDGTTDHAQESSTPNAHGKKSGIRTLNPAQLEKKRANDREAQRAIRERTKKQIESLEQKIRDLESGEAYRQLQDALKQREAVEAENLELKRRFAQILELARPFNGMLDATNAQKYEAQGPTDERLSSNILSDAPLHSYSSASRTPVSHPHLSHGINEAYRSLGASWERTSEDANISYVHTKPATQQSSSSQYFDNEGAERSAKRPRRMYGTPTSLPSTPGIYNHLQYPASNELATRLPLNIHPTCSFDAILHDFFSSARRQISEGASIDEVVGPDAPVLNGLFEGDSTVMRKHPLSELLIGVLKGFTAINGFPEKLSVIWCMYQTARWHIAPSVETYRRVPPSHIPVDEQLKVAHPIWIDYIPWPKMRAKMVYQYPVLPLDTFFYPYTTTLSMRYKSDEMQDCCFRDQNDCIRVQPDLAAHCSDANNWTVGPYFAQSLPKLADCCPVRDEGARPNG